ncbi:MAG: molybdopterin-dependent oxidoreductase, partial [Pyrinomonadaceae bacterium]|nr:molybdopterin-dependent oxidoreductase [Phycisphaerales bacterium]
PRNNNALEPVPKLVPTCQTACSEGMVVYTDSPKAVANQKGVMEYLLINHPLDCPVCDQAGECTLQDYSYDYGRGVSRFEESKVKQPKKDLGPHVYLYADRCIMCTRCVRFTREVSGTAELLVQGRGNQEQIDVFPGVALDNELSANVVDLCPVGALLEKDFLFSQRVWFLKRTPSIDGITASGDNISIEHNQGKLYRFKPRINLAVNKWWITDEVRYGWKHVHSEARLTSPLRKQFGVQIETEWARGYSDAFDGIKRALGGGGGTGGTSSKRLALMVSPMLSCEEAFILARAAQAFDPRAVMGVGPIPMQGQDKTFPAGHAGGFKMYAEKCPNSRGVRRVLHAASEKTGGAASVLAYEQFIAKIRAADVAAVILTGNYPSDWITPELIRALEGRFVVAIDTHSSTLTERADIVLPGATWVEKAGTFQNARDILQAFEAAIPCVGGSRPEGQIAQDLLALAGGRTLADASRGRNTVVYKSTVQGTLAGTSIAGVTNDPDSGVNGTEIGQISHDLVQSLRVSFNAADVRAEMAGTFPALGVFVTDVHMPQEGAAMMPEMEMVEI